MPIQIQIHIQSYTNTYIHIYIYIYIYIYKHTFSASRKPSGRFFFYGFRRRPHPMILFYGFFFFMVSAVAGNISLWFPSLFFFLFSFFMVSVVAGKHIFFLIFMVSVLAAASRTIFNSPQIRDGAGDTRARIDSDIVMRSPAAKDPDLTSGLRGFNPGRARFKVIAFACFCLLVACFCLFLLVFGSFPSREAKPRSRAEKQCYVSCFRYVSVAFPLRFRCVSVAHLPVASA